MPGQKTIDGLPERTTGPFVSAMRAFIEQVKDDVVREELADALARLESVQAAALSKARGA